jgi:hypothetical protein
MKLQPEAFKTAAQAAGRIIEKVSHGESAFVDAATKKKRLSICDSCDYRDGVQCSKCLCLIRAKILFSTESCPEALW